MFHLNNGLPLTGNKILSIPDNMSKFPPPRCNIYFKYEKTKNTTLNSKYGNNIPFVFF